MSRELQQGYYPDRYIVTQTGDNASNAVPVHVTIPLSLTTDIAKSPVHWESCLHGNEGFNKSPLSTTISSFHPIYRAVSC